MPTVSSGPAPFASFILLTEVAEGQRLADPIFRRKFEQPANDFGHHMLALYDAGELGWMPVSYVKYWEADGLMFSGGGCTDGRVLRRMSPEQQTVVRAAGGVLMWLMRYAEQRLCADKPGTFGYCGDERAWEVFDQVGYERTEHAHLIVCWHQRPAAAAARDLIDRVHALGPF